VRPTAAALRCLPRRHPQAAPQPSTVTAVDIQVQPRDPGLTEFMMPIASNTYDTPHVVWVLVSATPYHLARAEAAQNAGLKVTMVELCGRDVFGTLATRMAEDERRIVLFPGQTFPEVPRREMPRRIRAALDKLAPEVVAINGWSEGGAIASLRWALKHQVPTVMFSESTAYDEPRVWWKEAIKRRIVRLCSAYQVGGTLHEAYVRELLGEDGRASPI